MLVYISGTRDPWLPNNFSHLTLEVLVLPWLVHGHSMLWSFARALKVDGRREWWNLIPFGDETKYVAIKNYEYTLGLPPTLDASHHQDYYIFSRESRTKPSFATVTGWGVDPKYTWNLISLCFSCRCENAITSFYEESCLSLPFFFVGKISSHLTSWFSGNPKLDRKSSRTLPEKGGTWTTKT